MIGPLGPGEAEDEEPAALEAAVLNPAVAPIDPDGRGLAADRSDQVLGRFGRARVAFGDLRRMREKEGLLPTGGVAGEPPEPFHQAGIDPAAGYGRVAFVAGIQ